jgi:phosphoglucan, water dikinase
LSRSELHRSAQIATSGADVRGVVLCQDLPHLSHLGVRARQERVPFATCVSHAALARDVTPLLGSPVRLSVTSDGVSLTEISKADLDAESRSGAGNSSGARAGKQDAAKRVSKGQVLPLAKAEVHTSGAKAASCGKLAAIASEAGATFSAPAGAVLPFGCMEAAVKAAGAAKEFEALLSKLESAEVGKALDEACTSMQNLILDECAPDGKLVQQLQQELGDASIVIARSSANVEDLEGISGAGLYESIPNIDASDAEALADGVAEVWASLFSRRGVLSRRAASIAQADACMAVLVQVRHALASFVMRVHLAQWQPGRATWLALACALRCKRQPASQSSLQRFNRNTACAVCRRCSRRRSASCCTPRTR